jgi:hypothetical protein
MRIQEHLYQGFFGIAKKKDAAKYYAERMSKLKGLDDDLDKDIEEFKKILSNHRTKLDAYYNFLNKLDKESLRQLKQQIKTLEGMFDPDENANRREKKYTLRVKNIISDLLKNEENSELDALEKEVIDDLNHLNALLDSISPLWEEQLAFVRKNEDEILANKNHVQVISDILKEEGDILRMEESLLKKIDLKTGAILRKTSLKMRDLEKTKDMNMNYREIKHIR